MDKNQQRAWPSLTSRLFAPTPAIPSPRPHVALDLLQPDFGHNYREGYYQLGMLAIKRLADRDSAASPPVGLTYPTLYVFRHYLELALKQLIGQCAKLASEAPPGWLASTHDLMRLWTELERLIPPAPSGDDTIQHVRRCLEEFNAIDPKSFTFRYSEDREGNSVAETIPFVELGGFEAAMHDLHAFFYGCEAYADELLELKRDAEREWAGPSWP